MSHSKKLTEKEIPIMKELWDKGPLFIREIVASYDEPRPHFNTVATQIRILEDKGYVAHEAVNGSHRFYALVPREYFAGKSLSETISSFFNNSYTSVVSALVSEEKISVDELREIIEMVEKQKKEK